VNIFGLRFTSDAQKRAKNGQPPHKTTGEASANWRPCRAGGGSGSAMGSPNIASSTTPRLGAALTQNPGGIERYAGSAASGESFGTKSIGSSAMPHTGHVPGANLITSGCIGQV